MCGGAIAATRFEKPADDGGRIPRDIRKGRLATDRRSFEEPRRPALSYSSPFKFDIPSRIIGDRRGSTTTQRIVWIHQAHNAKHCHFYHEVPGDEPNFYVEVQNWDGPSGILDDLQTDDDLEAWLQELQSTGATTI